MPPALGFGENGASLRLILFESWSLANDVSTRQQQGFCRLVKKQHAPAFHHSMGSCSRSNDVPNRMFPASTTPMAFWRTPFFSGCKSQIPSSSPSSPGLNDGELHDQLYLPSSMSMIGVQLASLSQADENLFFPHHFY